ncbi:hypothetical protein GYMLUDRAFT_64822 [Collybiopsis luxurians FD-317 M1]|uniref:Uncharacterized protein n=1 Tax=Collybiopsis luxurians FD-317 M1 TaxID=944289 RepID=A0A0D0C174_9AGAR|nr:hypothetical protein GYMLUDRAFT_64822 [Collybiopsis luxurians FD-317 M1]
MYLLQQPDHYKSHTFVPFYWKSFVSEAQSYWHPDDCKNDNKVVLLHRKGKLIGLSSTFDYTHRPDAHASYNLYEWLWQFKRVKKPKKKQPLKVPDSEDEGDSSDSDSHKMQNSRDGQLQFLAGHPLQTSHVVSVTREYDVVIPNFIGPPLPRPDKGDREYYCSAMLTFFKLWRSGQDLKTETQSWDEAFDAHKFTEQDLLHLKNMNLRYECLDSRDDFCAQLKAGTLMQAPGSNIAGDDDIIQSVEQSIESALGNNSNRNEGPNDWADIVDDAVVLYDAESGMKAGRTHLARENGAKEIRDILFNSGWTNTIGPLSSQAASAMPPPIAIKRREVLAWNLLIADARDRVLSGRKEDANRPPQNGLPVDKAPPEKKLPPFNPNVAEICDRSYFDNLGIEYGSIKNLIQSVLLQFHLNDEQECAF